MQTVYLDIYRHIVRRRLDARLNILTFLKALQNSVSEQNQKMIECARACSYARRVEMLFEIIEERSATLCHHHACCEALNWGAALVRPSFSSSLSSASEPQLEAVRSFSPVKRTRDAAEPLDLAVIGLPQVVALHVG
jgi:hypothetical protein